jgi:hypothetical protein
MSAVVAPVSTPMPTLGLRLALVVIAAAIVATIWTHQDDSIPVGPSLDPSPSAMF